MKDNFKKIALQGMTWKLLEKIGMQAAQLIIQLILARLLLPEEYGIVGLLTIFITISDIFVQQSFSIALIQKKDADDNDFSIVHLINIVFSIIVYLVLFLMAPFIEIFFAKEQLALLMRILALNIIIGALGAVPNAILSRNLDFKKSFFRNSCNILTQGIVGIWLALLGGGIWALILSKLMGTLVGVMVLRLSVRWKEQIRFSFDRIKVLFRFGSRIMMSNLINAIFNNLNSLIIGKYYSSIELGLFQKGQQIPQTIMTAVDGSFSDVLFPTLSEIQNDLDRLKHVLRKFMRTSMFIVFPIMMGLIGAADNLIGVLLKEKWIMCVPYLRLQCVLCIFWPLAARIHAINAVGRSDITLKISTITRSMMLVTVLICVKYGIVAIMSGMIATSFISLLISTYYVNKYINYSLKELCKDIVPSFILSFGMGACVFGLNYFPAPMLIKLVIQICLGVIIYVMGSVLFKFESFVYLKSIAMEYFEREKK